MLHMQGGDIQRRGHQIIHQRGGYQLTVGVVDQRLKDGIAHALRDGALHLSFDDIAVQDRAAVLDNIVLLDLHPRRVGIDAHDCDMRPIAEDLVRRIIRTGGLQPGRYGLWKDNLLRTVVGGRVPAPCG